MGLFLTVAVAAGAGALLEKMDGTIRGRVDLLHLLAEAPLILVPTIGTDQEARVGRQRLRLALGAIAVAAVSAVLAIHFLYRPVDVLWFQALRKFRL